MDFKVGDVVWISSLEREGRVVGEAGKGWVKVQLDEETTIPISLEKLAYVEDGVDVARLYKEENKYETPQPTTTNEHGLQAAQAGIWLHFFPLYEGELLMSVRIYLSNVTTKHFLISFSIQHKQEAIFTLDKTQLHPNAHLHLYTYALADFKTSNFQCVLYQEGLPPISLKHPLSPKQFYEKVMDLKGEPSYAVLLAKGDFGANVSQEEKKPLDTQALFKPRNVRSCKSRHQVYRGSKEETIDLHLEKLAASLGIPPKNYHTWTAHEKKMFQINQLSKKIAEAASRGVSKLIVIHGMGSGALKQACIAHLNTDPMVKSWTDGECGNFPLPLLGKLMVYF